MVQSSRINYTNMAHFNLQTAIEFLNSTFQNYDVISSYAGLDAIDIVFRADGKLLELFSNTDIYFQSEKFVIIEN